MESPHENPGKKGVRFPEMLEERKEEQGKRAATLSSSPNSSMWERVESWLDAEGISFQTEADFNSHRHLIANMKNLQIHLSEPKVRRGVLAVQSVVSLDDQQVWKAKRIKKEDLRTIFLTLFEKLDREEFLFMLQEDFFSKSWLRIQRTLYIEDLTRTALIQEMRNLNLRFVDVNYDLNAALDNAPRQGSEEETIYS